jgi:hypothetical protein
MKKTLLIVFVFTYSFCALSQNRLLELTSPEVNLSNEYNGELEQAGMSSVNVSDHYCGVLKEQRELLGPWVQTPEHRAKLDIIASLRNLCSVITDSNDNETVVGFRLEQKFSNGTIRSYLFSYPFRSLRDPVLRITDDSKLTGRMSHDLLETDIQFIPRKAIPYIKVNSLSPNTKREIVISTGESIVVDFNGHKIVGGVLSEKAPSNEASRHTRKFADFTYSGNGIMIQVNRRAGTPRHNYNVSFNRNEKLKHATLTHNGKTCTVLKSDLWHNTDNGNVSTYLKYESDQELMDNVITPQCGWTLDLNSF